MEPTLREGAKIWVFRWAYLFLKPKVGQVILFRNGQKEFVKRVVEVRQDSVVVAGDNSDDSLDSRQLGVITFKQIKGRVLI